MKQTLFAILLLLCVSGIVSADYTIGPNIAGDAWSSNSSTDNTTEVQATNNIELSQSVDDYVSYWRFDENTTVDENTTNSNDGTREGVTYNATGKYGGAFDYDGSTDYINISDDDSLSFGDGTTDYPFSVSAWIFMNDATKFAIVSKATHTTVGDCEWKFGMNSNDELLFIMWDNVGSYYIGNVSDATMTGYEGTWVHVIGTYNGSGTTAGIKLYVNGALVAATGESNAYSTMHAGNTPVTIGAILKDSPTWDEWANGVIDDVRIYNYTISQAEINQTRDNDHHTSGNLTTWHDAGSGNETYQITVNCTTPTNTNYTVYYRENNTGNYVSLASMQTGNTTHTITGTKYQDTQVTWQGFGNVTLTPELIGMTLKTQASGGTPDPINLDHTKDSTWVNHTWDAGSGNVTDSYNVSVNDTWHNGTTNEYYNNTPIPEGNWSNITVWAWNSTYSELSSGSVSEDVQTGVAPSITAYYPTVTIWPEVADSQLFNVTVNQSTQCRWYVNGSLAQTNATPSLTHAYTNTSLEGGGCNVTAVCNNTNGTDSQTWIFEVGADSITYIVLSEDDTNLSCLIRWNVTRVGSNVTHWNTSYSNTTAGCTYYFNFDNDTEILNQTASMDDEELWFNSSTLLPTGIYYINGSCPYNYITLYANEYALINNWTADRTFSQIATNISNDVCYSWYNYTSGLWESYYVGYSYNSANVIPKNCSAFVFVDGETTISATPNTGGITIQNASWFYGYLPGSTAKTLTEIETAMDADGLDVWSLYGWSNATQAYTVTGGYSMAPNEGYSVYVNTTGEFTP